MKRSVEIKLADEYDRRLRALPDFVSQFCQEIENSYSQRSILTYLKDYTTFFEFLLILPEFEHRHDIAEFDLEDLRKVTRDDITHFLSYLTHFKKTFLKQNGETQTQWFTNDRVGKARKLASLRTLFQRLSRNPSNGLTDVTQFIDVTVKRTRKIKERLSDDDIDCLTSVISDGTNIDDSRTEKLHAKMRLRDLAIVSILAYTGIRISELVQLDISDISLPSQAIRVIRKGGDQDIVTLPSDIMANVEEYHAQRLKMTIPDALHREAFFVSLHKKRIDDRTVRALLAKYRERSGVDIKVTPHTFRRTFGTKLYDLSGNIQLVADALGQRSTQTTRNHYVETSQVILQQATIGFSYGEKRPLPPPPAPGPSSEDARTLKGNPKTLEHLATAAGMTVDEVKKLLMPKPAGEK